VKRRGAGNGGARASHRGGDQKTPLRAGDRHRGGGGGEKQGRDKRRDQENGTDTGVGAESSGKAGEPAEGGHDNAAEHVGQQSAAVPRRRGGGREREHKQRERHAPRRGRKDTKRTG